MLHFSLLPPFFTPSSIFSFFLALEEVELPEQSQYAIRQEGEKKQKKRRKIPNLRCTLNAALAKNSSQHTLIENQ